MPAQHLLQNAALFYRFAQDDTLTSTKKRPSREQRAHHRARSCPASLAQPVANPQGGVSAAGGAEADASSAGASEGHCRICAEPFGLFKKPIRCTLCGRLVCVMCTPLGNRPASLADRTPARRCATSAATSCNRCLFFSAAYVTDAIRQRRRGQDRSLRCGSPCARSPAQAQGRSAAAVRVARAGGSAGRARSGSSRAGSIKVSALVSLAWCSSSAGRCPLASRCLCVWVCTHGSGSRPCSHVQPHRPRLQSSRATPIERLHFAAQIVSARYGTSARSTNVTSKLQSWVTSAGTGQLLHIPADRSFDRVFGDPHPLRRKTLRIVAEVDGRPVVQART